ncbi:hypothetical protein P8452_64349 [Trifolium repens]|nr:hypothetical protein P8452_64349 [Trifolium repens]
MHFRAISSNQCLISISNFTSNSSSSLRCFCSVQTQIVNNGVEQPQQEEEELVQNEKPRSRNSSKTAKTMVNLINFKPWSNGLLSSFTTSLSKTTVLQTLRHIKVPLKAFMFFNWVHEKGFSHNPQSYFMMLQILGREKNLNVARNFLFSIEKRSNGEVKLKDKFFNSLIRSYGEAGLFKESMKLFETMKSIGVSPSVITFNSVLLVLLRRGRTNMAKEVYDEMLNTYGVTPDDYTFNILIRGFCKNSSVDEGFHFFREMTRFNCDPDVVTYNTLVDGLCRAGKIKVAHNLVNGMSKKCKDLSPDVVTYTTLIRGYCMKQELDEALVILEEMNGRGLKPNIFTYNTLIKGLCESNKWDKMKDILEQMKGDGGSIPDACTFNTLISSHCSAGNLDEAFKIFENMKKLELSADSASYSVLIRNLCLKGDYDKAERLLDELFEEEILLHDYGPKPLAASYRRIFQYLCEHGKTKKAERLLRQLMKRGTQDPLSYKIVILGHCKEGAFENGYGLLIWMLRRDFIPIVDIYDSLIDGLLQKDKPLLAKDTLEKMLKSSYQPETKTWHSILSGLLEKGCVNESADVIVMMLERNIRQNINLSTKCLQLLFVRGIHDKAFKINELIYKNGYCVKMDEVVQFLRNKGRTLEACKMLVFCLKNNQNINIDLCNSVILDLCKINKASEAFSLCYELVEKGLHQDLICLNDLVTALEAGGRIVEAAFISKRIPRAENLDRSERNNNANKSKPDKM